jgi:predicted nucleotidyltransferase
MTSREFFARDVHVFGSLARGEDDEQSDIDPSSGTRCLVF